MVKLYNTFYDLDVVKRTKDLVDLPQGMVVSKFNILYGNDISGLAEGSVVMVTDIKLKTLGFFRKYKDENKFNIRDRGANWDVVFMDVTSHTGLDFDAEEYFKEDDEVENKDTFCGVIGESKIKDKLKDKEDADSYENDVISRPSHYTYGSKFEIIEIIEEITKHYPPELAFAIGNAVKYISRAEHKNGKEDIKKSVWYLQHVLDKWDDTHE